jgi:peptidoglycan hydrolase-like protein with peptidoglycan-binding domain
VCVLESPAEGSPQQLRFRFEPGDKFFLVSVNEQTTTQVVDGNQQVTSQTIRLGCDLDIEEVEEDGCAWAKYTYRQAAMKINDQGVNIAFDSDANQPKVPPLALPLATAVGEGFYIRITPQGRIDKINGLQAVASSAKAKVPNIATRNQVVQAIDKQFSEAVVKRELEDQMAVFPDANAGTGPASARFGETGDPCLVTRVTGDEQPATTWNRTEQVDEDKIVVERIFRLRERGASGDTPGIAVIEVNVVIRPAANVIEQVAGGVRTRREISGQGAGQLEIDEATGRIINKRLTRDTVEETKVSSEGQVLRIPPVPGPTTKHIVKTFQMITRLGDGAAVEETGTPSRSRKRDSGKPPPGGVEGSQPNQP